MIKLTMKQIKIKQIKNSKKNKIHSKYFISIKLKRTIKTIKNTNNLKSSRILKINYFSIKWLYKLLELIMSSKNFYKKIKAKINIKEIHNRFQISLFSNFISIKLLLILRLLQVKRILIFRLFIYSTGRWINFIY